MKYNILLIIVIFVVKIGKTNIQAQAGNHFIPKADTIRLDNVINRMKSISYDYFIGQDVSVLLDTLQRYQISDCQFYYQLEGNLTSEIEGIRLFIVKNAFYSIYLKKPHKYIQNSILECYWDTQDKSITREKIAYIKIHYP